MSPAAVAAALSLALILAPGVATAQRDDHEESRNATIDARGARLVRVEARAGVLRVYGKPGITEVRVNGTARASDADDLAGIRLSAEREGDVVVVKVDIEEQRDSWNNSDRRRVLDLVIDVPEGIAMDVDDTSGDLELHSIGALELEDNSGDIDLRDIRGAVRIQDNSGDLEVRGARGDVRVEDGSGDIRLHNVTGNVTIESDGSGGIHADDVTGFVHVREDGSGGIRVADVGGDFTVDRDGSGGIDMTRVRGQVRIPGGRRRY